MRFDCNTDISENVHTCTWLCPFSESALTLSALIAAYKFSKLISIHFLTYYLGEFEKWSEYFSFGDYFINSLNLFS